MRHQASHESPFDPKAENDTAAALYRLASAGHGRILVIGPGAGVVATPLQSLARREVTYADASEALLDAARQRGVGQVLHADLDDAAWCEHLRGQEYDVVVMANVLEGLRDPGAVLDRVRDCELLADGGFLVVSFRNTAHEAVIASLLAGPFAHTETGTLDAARVGFTRKPFCHLCERHGYLVTRLERIHRPMEQTGPPGLADAISPSLRRELADTAADTSVYEYVARVEPMEAATQLARLRSELDAERSRRRELAEELRESRDHLEGRDSELADVRRQLERARAELARVSDHRHDKGEGRRLHREQALGRELEESRREQERLASKLEEVYASETWRVGRAVLWLPRLLRRRRRRARTGHGGSRREKSSRAPRGKTGHLAARYQLSEDLELRAIYERAVDKRRFNTDGVHVAMAVYTLDFDEGRGDIYTAVGLGRHLERLGYEVVYLAREDWYAPPSGTDVYLSLLAERDLHVDPLQIPEDCAVVGWVRNSCRRWKEIPTLGLYDALLCSSPQTLREMEQVFGGPCGLLPIGVDEELFAFDADSERRGAVATVNQWGKERELYRQLAGCSIDFPLAIHAQGGLPRELAPYHLGSASFFALPSLYQQAAVVLDDLQDVNRPYGNLNSRLYESLACGTVPITNATVGLEEAGLEDVPVFADGETLAGRVRDLLRRPDERDAIADRLRRVVIERHTYARRARDFDSFLTAHGLQKAPERRTGTVVGFFPDYRSTNPYQDMLYSTAERRGAVVTPTDVSLGLADAPVVRDRAFVFHLHWTAPILGPAQSRRQAVATADDFLEAVDDLRARGGRLVWTVHNVLPHECRFPDVEARLRQGIADRADAIHVMCAQTPDLVRPHFTLPPERVRVIPHAGYVDVYPNIIGEEEARHSFGLTPDHTVFLFLGGIRPYKGLEDLLDAFEVVAAQKPESRLLVAGRPGRFPEIRDLERRCGDHPQVVARFEAVDDVELQHYCNAADVVVFPYQRVLNSGSLLLAFSFGRPVVAPKTGCLTELITSDLGIGFEPGVDDLAEVLLKADVLREQRYREAAFQAALRFPYREMSAAFFDLVEQLSPISAAHGDEGR